MRTTTGQENMKEKQEDENKGHHKDKRNLKTK